MCNNSWVLILPTTNGDSTSSSRVALVCGSSNLFLSLKHFENQIYFC